MARTPPRIPGPRTAFAFFVQDSRRKYEAEHGGNPPTSFTDFMRSCNRTWELAAEQEKEHFQRLAIQDKIRYENQLPNIPNFNSGTRRPSCLHRGENFKTLKPKSSFYWFCEDNRSLVMQEYPDFHIGAISKELGKRWMNVSRDVRAKYEGKAKEDLSRYEKEMAERELKEVP